MTKADQVQSDTSQTNATGGTWMNLSLFSRNGSDANNSSWLSSDELDDQQAAAALQKYQQLGMKETDEEKLAAGPTLSLRPETLWTQVILACIVASTMLLSLRGRELSLVLSVQAQDCNLWFCKTDCVQNNTVLAVD